jgi:hypothetical protein
METHKKHRDENPHILDQSGVLGAIRLEKRSADGKHAKAWRLRVIDIPKRACAAFSGIFAQTENLWFQAIPGIYHVTGR